MDFMDGIYLVKINKIYAIQQPSIPLLINVIRGRCPIFNAMHSVSPKFIRCSTASDERIHTLRESRRDSALHYNI